MEYSLDDFMYFGKYKNDDRNIRDIIDNDPDYMEWVLDEVDGFELDGPAMGYYLKTR